MNGRATVQNSIDAWNAGDREAWLGCYTDDCEFAAPGSTEKGMAAAAALWDIQMTAGPGLQVRVGLLIESGDTVAEEAVVEGTNTGPTRLPDGSEIPPSGKDFAAPFAALHTVRDGRIASSRFYWDQVPMQADLGLLPG